MITQLAKWRTLNEVNTHDLQYVLNLHFSEDVMAKSGENVNVMVDCETCQMLCFYVRVLAHILVHPCYRFRQNNSLEVVL